MRVDKYRPLETLGLSDRVLERRVPEQLSKDALKIRHLLASFRTKRSMEEVVNSHFKARCLALLERVRQTKKPLRVTRPGNARC